MHNFFQFLLSYLYLAKLQLPVTSPSVLRKMHFHWNMLNVSRTNVFHNLLIPLLIRYNFHLLNVGVLYFCNGQKQPPRGVPWKRCSENMQQIYRRTSMPSAISIKLLCNFIKIALRHGCSPVNLLHIFRTPIPRNTSGWLLLYYENFIKI